MGNILQNHRVLIVVTGSIAAYKALELVRLFVKAGADVKVVMSESAKKFVTPLSFEALSANSVLHDGTESWANDCNHISLAKWAEVCVIAPATINFIAKLACGIADSLPLQTLFACSAKKIIAPAANTLMYQNKANITNMQILQDRGFELVSTQIKLLACKEIGEGAMADESEIFWHTARTLLKEEFWMDRDVLVTGGGSREAIDDVRFITNASSGKMAKAILKAAYVKGANITAIFSDEFLDLPKDIKMLKAVSAKDMLATLTNTMQSVAFKKEPFLFMAAAISDFTPTKIDGKIKKSLVPDEFNLTLYKSIDVLSSIDKKGFKTIGFKAEIDETTAFDLARNMLHDKELDAVVLNIIGVDAEFGSSDIRLRFISEDLVEVFDMQDKLSAAMQLLDKAKII